MAPQGWLGSLRCASKTLSGEGAMGRRQRRVTNQIRATGPTWTAADPGHHPGTGVPGGGLANVRARLGEIAAGGCQDRSGQRVRFGGQVRMKYAEKK